LTQHFIILTLNNYLIINLTSSNFILMTRKIILNSNFKNSEINNNKTKKANRTSNIIINYLYNRNFNNEQK